MRRTSQMMMVLTTMLLASAAGAVGPPSGPVKKCPPDSVVSGPGCMDKYEASVWRVPNPTTSNAALVTAIQRGRATIELLMAGGAKLLGTTSDDYAPCADSGQNCTDDIYAVSLKGVTASAFITWFQAQQACTNSRKRLPSNAEWQAATTGTPDPVADDGEMTCHIAEASTVLTGTRSRCVSSRGAFDMVGNVDEWVADWVPRSTNCGAWSVLVSATGDIQCLAGAATSGEPGALVRGGSFLGREQAGPLAVDGTQGPSASSLAIGVRCIR